MIIKNDFFKKQENNLLREKEGLNKAISNWDKRFKNKEIDFEKFVEQNEVFAKRSEKINKKFKKMN